MTISLLTRGYITKVDNGKPLLTRGYVEGQFVSQDYCPAPVYVQEINSSIATIPDNASIRINCAPSTIDVLDYSYSIEYSEENSSIQFSMDSTNINNIEDRSVIAIDNEYSTIIKKEC